MEHIGIVSCQGTILRPVPRQIRIASPNSHDEVFLDIYTGPSFLVLVGAHAGERIKSGDYLGAGGVWRSSHWVVRHPTKWVGVR
jgi:hypothetical protein